MKGETKEERFKRVVQNRVQNVLDSLRRLSQCSNKRMYGWDDEQLKKIWSAIDKELKSCKESFANAEPEQFRLQCFKRRGEKMRLFRKELLTFEKKTYEIRVYYSDTIINVVTFLNNFPANGFRHQLWLCY